MKTRRVLLANVLSVVVLASYGCSDDAANGTFVPKFDVNACTQEGEASCNEDGSRKVCRGGSYQNEACPSGQACKDNECRDTCVVSSFVPSCDGTSARFVCNGGFVASEACKSGEICNGGNCELIPVVETCEAATFKPGCAERTVQKICDGGKVKEVACDLGSVCVDGECGEPCTVGYTGECAGSTAVSKCKVGSDGVSGIIVSENCIDGVCEGNQCIVKKTCDDTAFKPVCENESSVTSCGSDHIQTVEPCPVGDTCEGGICQTFEESCQANEVRCVSAQIAERCVEGKFHQYYCNVGEELCSSGTCVPESSVEKCLLDDKPYCKNDKLVKCEYGVEVAHECGEDMICAGGKCVQCDPSSFVQKCADNKEVRCSAEGNIVSTDCPDGYACGSSSNACTKSCDATHPCEAPYICDDSHSCVFVPECDVATHVPECDGNSVKSCEAPGSFKTEACPAGSPCLNGKCVECDRSTYVNSCDGNAPTYCSEDGKITKKAACTGAKGVCFEGNCVACTPETAEHSCKDSKTELTCIENQYYWKECVAADNEICVADKGCVSKCGESFKKHCDADGKRVVCGDDGNPVTKSCEADEVCSDGKCVSIIGSPCNYYTYPKSCIESNGYVYLLYCDEGDAGIQRKYCSTIGAPSNRRFCGTMNGNDVGCYDKCDTLNSITCLTYSESAIIGMCKEGTDYLGNSHNGFSPETSICESDTTAVSCHLNAEHHATFDYLICDMVGGGTCSNAQKTCTSLPSCTAKGGQCSSDTAINCVFDPAQAGGAGGLVKTTQKCTEGVSCKTYVDDGVTYAVCNESAEFDVDGDNVKEIVSTLGTCIDKGSYKMLSRAYRRADGRLTARTIRCHNDCVTNADGFSYCK